jgi:hypothetical protein
VSRAGFIFPAPRANFTRNCKNKFAVLGYQLSVDGEARHGRAFSILAFGWLEFGVGLWHGDFWVLPCGTREMMGAVPSGEALG